MSYDIGLTGIAAARNALEIIGNNISNAATEGYHRQRLDLSPIYSSQNGSVIMGGGVETKSVTRVIDSLLEHEILRQQSSLEYLSQESTVLQSLENSFGELSSESSGINASLDKFFTSLQDLTAHPTDIIWQNQVLVDAQSLTSQFRTIGQHIDSIQNQIRLETDAVVSNVNTLTAQIADFNAKIEEIEMVGGQSNSMSDKRDQCISELSELIGVQTINREYGVTDVIVGGMPLVIGANGTAMKIGFNGDGKFGIAMAGENSYTTKVTGGKLGGLLSLKNGTVADIKNQLDTLANSIISEINKVHVNGVGSQGSFTELTSTAVADLSSLASVTSGELNIRVTNTLTGEVTRATITVDPASDTMTSIATDINGITGLTASTTADGRLTITAGANYEFDFSPAVLPRPSSTTFASASPPAVTVTGIYDGLQNDTYKFTVKGDGSVGNGTLQLEISENNGSGNVIKTVNIGVGYAAGDLIGVKNGIKISLGTGNLSETNNDSFSVKVMNDSDTSNLLSAIGMNTFFIGSGASNIDVSAAIAADPKRIAVSIGPDNNDNANAVKLAAIATKAVTGLNSLSCGEYYKRLVTDVGHKLSTTQLSQDNAEVMVLNLTNRRDDISGVDINDEAAQMMIYEQMFQAMAQYMNTINETMSTIMEIV